tara:strand:+ start:475 stop:1038 length:564 start_codon:yes stop_codon:yes gene_type:complete
MKKLLVLFILLPFFSFSQLGEYYYSKGHPKSKGLNFQIKKPVGFEQNEADRPNIVQKWEKYKTDNSKYVAFMIIVKKMDEFSGVSRLDWEQYLKHEGGVREMALAIPNASNYKFFKIDNYPGMILDAEMEFEQLDFSVKIYMTQITVFVESYGFTFQLQSPSKSKRDENRRILYLMANSILFPDQYK